MMRLCRLILIDYVRHDFLVFSVIKNVVAIELFNYLITNFKDWWSVILITELKIPSSHHREFIKIEAFIS